MKKNSNNQKMNKLSKIVLIFGIVIGIIGSCTSVIAVTYLYNANEISYSNTSSGLSATNVQDALDQVYLAANDYSKLRAMIYPVGSIYISATDNTVAKVEARFGGTWVKFGQGKTLVGVNSDDGDFNTVEKTSGSKTVTLATGNLPSHTHSIPALSGTAASNGAHTHSVTTNAKNNVAGTTSNGAHTHSVTTNAANGVGGTSNPGNHTHSMTNATNASGYVQNTVNGGSNYGFAWNGGSKVTGTNGAGGHTHTLNIPALSGTAASAGGHTHNLNIPALSGTAASAGAHTHTVTTTANTSGATGSGTAFSIVQPYITVYMYKRTA